MIRNFWDKKAHIYNHFIKKDARAYEKMYELMRPVVKGKTVLDLATGTGLIAGNLVGDAGMIEATDASPAMIAEAKSNYRSAKLHFSVQDMFCMPYVDNTFDVVIVANALHIVKEPERVLPEIRRVLKKDGILIAPTFTHSDNRTAGKMCSAPGFLPVNLCGMYPDCRSDGKEPRTAAKPCRVPECTKN